MTGNLRRAKLCLVTVVALLGLMAAPAGAADLRGVDITAANVDVDLPCDVSGSLFGACSGTFKWVSGSAPNACASEAILTDGSIVPGPCQAVGSGSGNIGRSGCASWTVNAGGSSLEFREDGRRWAIDSNKIHIEATNYAQTGAGDQWTLVPGVYAGGGTTPSGSYFRGREVGGTRTLTMTLSGTALAALKNCSAGSTISSVNLTVEGTGLVENL